MINLKHLRKSIGLTQKEMAELLGIKQQQYQRYEDNKTKITLEMFLKILEVSKYTLYIKKKNIGKRKF